LVGGVGAGLFGRRLLVVDWDNSLRFCPFVDHFSELCLETRGDNVVVYVPFVIDKNIFFLIEKTQLNLLLRI
jgi:hypothetical protein